MQFKAIKVFRIKFSEPNPCLHLELGHEHVVVITYLFASVLIVAIFWVFPNQQKSSNIFYNSSTGRTSSIAVTMQI